VQELNSSSMSSPGLAALACNVCKVIPSASREEPAARCACAGLGLPVTSIVRLRSVHGAESKPLPAWVCLFCEDQQYACCRACP
jgi:hypothetical protein